MRYYNYPKKPTVAEIRAKSERAVLKLRKKHPDIEPVIIQGRSIATSWWGKAWNINLESYADYSNRIDRGKSYVRSNTVIDLKISKGQAKAMVMGSRATPYDVLINIEPLNKNKWDRIIKLCNHRIETLEKLVDGKFPEELEILFREKEYGLFPSPKEIHFGCSCPDIAVMCKHVAAALYGIGSRLDNAPMLFFELRNINGAELVKKTVEQKVDKMLKNAKKKSDRQIPEKDLSGLFGL